MNASVERKYRPSPSRPQAGAATVKARGPAIDLGLPIPHEVAEWLFQVFMPGLVEIYRKSAERRRLLESLDDTDARRQLEIRESAERCQRIGRDAAAELHDRVTRGEAPYPVQREIALRHNLPVGVLGSFIADARRAIRTAREQERATEILHLHRAGRSNVEIGRALDMTPQHVGRLLRKAQATLIGSSHA